MLSLDTGERVHFGLPGSMNGEFSPIEGETCGPDERYAAAQRKCEWKADDDGTYWTGCDQAFVFNEGGPNENGMKFCPYCGAELVTPNLNLTTPCRITTSPNATPSFLKLP